MSDNTDGQLDDVLDEEGWPTGWYFMAVRDALVAEGIRVRDWLQMPPGDAQYVLDTDALAGWPLDGPETARGLSVEWTCETPPGCMDLDSDDYSSHGWFYVYGADEVRGDLLVPAMAEPVEVAAAVARLVRPGPWPAMLDFRELGADPLTAFFSGRVYRPVEATACGARDYVPAQATSDGVERRLLCDRARHEDGKHRQVVDAAAGRVIEWAGGRGVRRERRKNHVG